jgi:hypothetical protein
MGVGCPGGTVGVDQSLYPSGLGNVFASVPRHGRYVWSLQGSVQ